MHSTIRRALYGLSALSTFADNATAQPHYLEPPRELAPGVFAILQRLPFLISDSNVLLIINDDDVVVVDANIVPSSARHVLAEIRRLTTKPVRYVVNTHWHSDHHYGNAVYREAFPGVEFIQHVETRKAIIERDMPALKANVDSAYPAAATTLRKALQEGKTATGVELTAAMRDRFTDMAGIYDLFVADMKVTPMVPGTLLITDSLVLQRGKRTIVIKHLGLGNTAGDLVVHLPRERIVATGDLVVFPVPFAFYSYLSQWPKTLRNLTALDAATIMPGHGPIMTSWNYANQLIPMIESTWQQVSRAVASGVSELDSVQKHVNLDQYRDQLAGTDARIRQQFDTWYMRPAVESAFREIRPDTTKR